MALAALAASSGFFGVVIGGAFGDVVFVRPLALWGLAVAVPVLLAHLYRKRRRRLAVAFVPLVREAVGPVHARGAWKRLREAARLLCRIGAVAALALASAGPKPAEAATPIEDLVIVLDADETTTCREPEGGPLVGKTRFDRQVALAKAHVLAHPRGRVGVVSAEPTPRTIVAPSDDRAVVVVRLDERDLRPHQGRGDLAAAVEVARSARSGERPSHVLLITSRDVPATVANADLTVVGAGSADDNQGFVDASVTPDSEGKGFDVRGTLRNVSSAAVKRTLVARLADDSAGVVKLPSLTMEIEIAAGSEIDVSTHIEPTPDHPIFLWTLSTEDRTGVPAERDAWESDDAFFASLVPRARPSVLVIHGETPRPFVRALLDAMGETIDRKASGFVPVSGALGAKPRDVTIVDGVAVPPGALKKGAWIFISPLLENPVGTLPFRVGREVKEPLVWRAETSDPLLRGVDLTTAYVARGNTIAGDGVHALATVEGEAVVADGAKGDVRWLAFGLDPEGSDLPIRAALPLLLANAIRRMGEMPKSPLKPFYRDGEPITPRVDLGATTVTDEPPGLPSVRGASDRFRKRVESWGPSNPLPFSLRHGLYYASTAHGGLHRLAIPRLDRTFDIRPVRPPSPPPPPAPPPPEDEAARWLRWLLVVAGALLVVDLLLGALQRSDGQRFVAQPARSA